MDPREQLHQLIYSSIASPGLKLSEITSFLATAEKRNAESGVSGALVFANGTFLQLIEGERISVSETFARIQRDDRHHSICLIDFRTSRTRRFHGWAMRHLGFSNDAFAAGFEPQNWSVEECLKFFERYQAEIVPA